MGGMTLKRRRSRQRSVADGTVNLQAVLDLLTRQGFRCALTGRNLTPETASLDHVVPICRGGAHHIGNTQVLERTVNRAKGTLTNDEFLALCREVCRHTLNA
jgi:5-methylcytosine-specific restriction endonuclease McrA